MDSPKNTSGVKKIDVQGHRGCRGLMPENTIPAFMKAMELGVSTLELDLVISKDRQVIVSHEPFFNHEISSIDGKRITEEAEKTHNIYQLTREELTKYDVGLMSHQRFPDQKNIPAQKPTLVELATAVHEKCKTLKIPLPYFNVEIKRVPEQDNIFHPEAKEFAELVIAAIYKGGIENKTYIQSFDPASLEQVRLQDAHIPLVYLIDNKDSIVTNLNKLSFIPEVYSPYYKLVDTDLVSFCKSSGMQLIPWTVNEKEEMIELLNLGVDGIISDYPDRLLSVVNGRNEFEILY